MDDQIAIMFRIILRRFRQTNIFQHHLMVISPNCEFYRICKDCLYFGETINLVGD